MPLLIIAVVVITSVSAAVVGLTFERRSARSLRMAVLGMLECVGTMFGFYVVNAVLTILAVSVLRQLAGFVPLYVLADEAWILLATLQGLTWWLWRRAS